MFKVRMKLLLIQLATGVVLTLVSVILLSLFYALWGLLIGPIIFGFFGGGYRYEYSMGAVGTIIFSGLVSLAGSFFIGLMIRSWLAPTYVWQSDVDRGRGYFARRIRDKKFLHNSRFVLLFVPSTILGMAGLAVTIYFGGIVYAQQLAEGWNFLISVPITTLSVMFLTTGIMGMILKDPDSQCPKCKCMYSFVYQDVSGRSNSSYTQNKTRNVTETLGELRDSNDEHIADVTHTYAYDYSRSVNVSSWKVYKYCANCGKEVSEAHSERTYGEWK